MAKLGIIGSQGRMGQAIAAAIADAGHSHAGGVDAGDAVTPLAQASEALIDFPPPWRWRQIWPLRARLACPS